MTVEKMITELNSDELIKVYNANATLRENIQTDLYESEMMYINDMLDCFKEGVSDYSISGYGYTYITVDANKVKTFIEGVMKANSNYGMLPDSELPFVDEVEKKINELYNMEMYIDQYDELEEEILKDAQDIADKIDKTFKDILEYTYEEENGIEYLKDFYANERIENTYIIVNENGNSDYILNENIVKTYN